MYRLLSFALIPMLLGAAEITIDHVTVAGQDLKSMQARLSAVGIQSVYGGPHSNHATEMSLTSFPDGSYLELIAIQPQADPAAVAAHSWSRQLRGDSGPTAWAARVKDMAAEVARLKAAGVAVSAPEKNGRAKPDGTRLEWETAQVGEQNGTFFPFLIHDFTPRENRAFTKGKPVTTDFGGILRVVIAVPNLEDAVKKYRAAFNLTEPIRQVDQEFGAHLAYLGNTPVILAAPLNASSWLHARLEQFGEGPCAYILSARRAGRYKPASKSRWFGVDISWFDPTTLGWRLGFAT